MEKFRLWYQGWIQKQELTITRREVAEEAFEAGVRSAARSEKKDMVDDKEINTHKGSF